MSGVGRRVLHAATNASTSGVTTRIASVRPCRYCRVAIDSYVAPIMPLGALVGELVGQLHERVGEHSERLGGVAAEVVEGDVGWRWPAP